MTTITKTQRTTNAQPWLIGLGILAVIGFAAWIVQLVLGAEVLGTGQNIVWGVYIALFFLLAGTGGGLVILAALGDLQMLPALAGYRRPLLLAALASFVAAGIVILMDIGKPERVFGFITSLNFRSMFVWDFYALVLSVIVAAAYLYLGAKGKGLPIIALILAPVLVLVEGLILAVSAGSPFWHSALLPVLFLLEGLLTALALLVLFSHEPEVMHKARGWLIVLLATVFVLNVLEIVTVSMGGNPEAVAGLYLLTSFGLAPLFWGQLLFGLVLPFVLLVWAPQNRTAVGLAAVLAFVGVFVAKLDLLVAGQALPYLQPAASYVPSVVEILGVIGMVGLAAFLFVLGQRVIPSKA